MQNICGSSNTGYVLTDINFNLVLGQCEFKNVVKNFHEKHKSEDYFYVAYFLMQDAMLLSIY